MTTPTETESDFASEDRAGQSLWRDLAAVMISPRRTIRRIIESDPDRFLKSIFILAILSVLLEDPDLQGLREISAVSPWLLGLNVVIGITFAILFMLLAYYVLSWSATLVGRWLGGEGGFREVRAAIAWGLAPLVWALMYRVPATLVSLFSNDDAAPPRLLIDEGRIEWSRGAVGAFDIGWFLLLVLLELTVVVWYLFVASRTLGEAHRVSSWRGIAILILSFIFPVAAIVTLLFVGWIYVDRIG